MEIDGLREAEALLAALWPGAVLGTGLRFVEFRAIWPDGRIKQRFCPVPFDPDALHLALSWAFKRNNNGAHVYFGVNLRDGHRGRSADVPDYQVLVTDYDSEEHAERAMELVLGVGLTPTAVTRTGRGNHFYFALGAPVHPAVGQRVAKRLCAWTGSDAVHDAPRVMRLPGTKNWKFDPPRVALLTPLAREARYSIEEIEAALDRSGAPAAVEPHRRSSGALSTTGTAEALAPLLESEMTESRRAEISDLSARVSVRIRHLIVGGHADGDGYPSRSEADMAVVRALVDAGGSDDAVIDVFRLHPAGIGERAFESGRTYLERTIATARSAPSGREVVELLVEGANGRHGDRVVLDLLVLDGPRAGLRFSQGLSHGTDPRDRVVVHAFASAGLGPPQWFESTVIAAALKGRRLRGTLHDAPGGVEVKAWEPIGIP